MKRPKLLLFFALTFAISWALWLTVVFSGQYYLDFPAALLYLLGGFGPSAAGVILVLRTYNREAWRDFFRRTWSFRSISPGWLLFIILVFPLVNLLAIGISLALGGPPPGGGAVIPHISPASPDPAGAAHNPDRRAAFGRAGLAGLRVGWHATAVWFLCRQPCAGCHLVGLAPAAFLDRRHHPVSMGLVFGLLLALPGEHISACVPARHRLQPEPAQHPGGCPAALLRQPDLRHAVPARRAGELS
jgi:hypothetical protein